MILITGATRAVGREVVTLLPAQGLELRAVTLDLRSVNGDRLPHVEYVQGDFEDLEPMHRACDGVDRAFLLTPSTERAEEQQASFTRMAHQSGVQHLVKLSQLHAEARAPGRFLR